MYVIFSCCYCYCSYERLGTFSKKVCYESCRSSQVFYYPSFSLLRSFRVVVIIIIIGKIVVFVLIIIVSCQVLEIVVDKVIVF